MDNLRIAFGFVAWFAVVFAAAFAGSRHLPGAWYASLAKPRWNPPNRVFAPVWTALYLMMAVAAWLVWRRAGFAGAGPALTLFLAQLALNALWSWLFFGLRRPGAALLDILLLYLSIVAVTVMFWHVDRVAGALLLPYAAWVAFASLLNFALWRMNRGR